MRANLRPSLAAAACLFSLAGCETTSLPSLGDLFTPAGTSAPSTAAAEPPETGAVAAVEAPAAAAAPADSAEVQSSAADNPYDDLSVGKKLFREGNFALAERAFRRAAEASPDNAEAWVGLAASYDRLRQFDLADSAYARALKVAGPTPAILNNQGHSYILRGDYARAREKLLAAQAKDPTNPYISANLALLEESQRPRRRSGS